MADFIAAFKKTMGFEGDYSNDSADMGGETYMGISRVHHPGWVGWKLIDAKKKTPGFPGALNADGKIRVAAQQFYKNTFWDPYQGDQFSDQDLAEELFDTCVNMGIKTGVKFLQRSLNLLNREGTVYPDIAVDGAFGKGSLAVLKVSLSRDNGPLILTLMNILQGMNYVEIMEKYPVQEKFARGWLSRVELKKKSNA